MHICVCEICLPIYIGSMKFVSYNFPLEFFRVLRTGQWPAVENQDILCGDIFCIQLMEMFIS